MKRVILILLLLILIVGCEEAEPIVNEEVVEEIVEDQWLTYEDDNGFSIEHPDWEEGEGDKDNLFVMTYAGCNLAVNRYDGNSEIMFDWLLKYMEEEVETEELTYNEKTIYYGSYHETYYFNNKVFVYDCNDQVYNVIMSCIDSIYDEEKYSNFFDSVSCDETMKEEVEYTTYNDQDFSVNVPDWEITEEDNAVVMSQSYCNLYIFENEAKAEDVYDWMYDSLDDCEDCSFEDGLTYNSEYENTDLKSKVGFNYCNKKTHMVTYTCIDSIYDEEVAEEIMDSLDCDEEITEIEEEEEEEIEPEEDEEIIEEVEDIKDEIVDLELPEEFGLLDPEWIVWFINSNDFFGFILEDYNEVNLIIESDTNFNIKADLENGKIVHVEEGLYEDANSIIVPYEDAVNILNNAENINFINFLIFAANVRTDPPELKQEVINKILGL